MVVEHKETDDTSDAELLELAMDDAGFTWYNESDGLLPRSSGSGHAQAFLRTRFNSIAATVLDTNRKVLPDTAFPNGSAIVKELFDDASTLALYHPPKKPSHPYADAEGWVWGYVRPDGEVREPSRNQDRPPFRQAGRQRRPHAHECVFPVIGQRQRTFVRHFPNIRSMLLATPMFTMDFRRLSTTALIALSSIGARRRPASI